jgi:GH15 family glucan-1,4-alpha-glucosidase
LFALFEFGVFSVEDEKVSKTMGAISEKLRIRTEVGGIARYTNDYYFRQSDDIDRVPGNPWIICTLWVAGFQIETARTAEALEEPRRTLEKVAGFALPGGNLPEQLHPETGEPLSVAPLTWSHATYVSTVCKYVKKLEQLAAGGYGA